MNSSASDSSHDGGAPPFSLLVLSEADVAASIQGPELLEPLANALASYSAGQATAPPRVAAKAADGWLGAMPAYLPARGLAAKLITVFPGNPGWGRPSHQGLIALFGGEDGTPICVMDAAETTALRTAAVSALSVRMLARDGARTLAVLGTGTQARAHLRLVPAVRQFAEVRLAGRTEERARDLAQDFSGCQVAPTFEACVKGADVVICCTDAPRPVVRQCWLGKGTHLVSVGAGAEVDDATVAAARIFVEWRGAVTTPPPAGAVELQGLDPDRVAELGEVISGDQAGRTSEEEVTVFKSTGLGVEDAAVGWAVLGAARRLGLGTEVSW
ncbi:MAG TPA: ornithine cyclodeaminase family protein [Candidatus Dormibacteraeota bacterium]